MVAISLRLRQLSAITFVLLSVNLNSTAHGSPVESNNWSRDFLEDLPENAEFVLATVMSIKGRLVGYFIFRNLSDCVLVLQGARTPDREFWPSVTAEVADTPNGPWKACSEWKNPGTDASLEVDPAVTAKLVVDLAPFQAHVGVKRYARILLNSGKAAVFELAQLRPAEQ